MGKMFLIIFLIIFSIFFLFSKNILSYTTESCNSHITSKDFFRLSFPFFHNIFNPSITKTESGYLCCLRLSTWSHKNLLSYIYGYFFYESYLLFLELDNSGNLVKIIYPFHKENLEDPRIIEYNSKYIVSATKFVDMKNIFPVLLIYDKNYNLLKRVDYNRLNYMEKDSSAINKNWCPFIHNNEVYIHTDTFPKWKVFKLDVDTGNMVKIIDTDIDFRIPSNVYLRCSTSWKIYDSNYYICGLHTKTKYKYPTIRSILVLIDRKTLIPSHKTDIACLEWKKHNRIQFLSGLEIDDFYVILAYGVDDSEIVVKRIAKYRLKFIPIL